MFYCGYTMYRLKQVHTSQLKFSLWGKMRKKQTIPYKTANCDFTETEYRMNQQEMYCNGRIGK